MSNPVLCHECCQCDCSGVVALLQCHFARRNAAECFEAVECNHHLGFGAIVGVHTMFGVECNPSGVLPRETCGCSCR